jgi:hypothetical protein
MKSSQKISLQRKFFFSYNNESFLSLLLSFLFFLRAVSPLRPVMSSFLFYSLAFCLFRFAELSRCKEKDSLFGKAYYFLE